KEPGARWTNLCECHELYCAGHLIEAAVAYYRATGKSKLLDVACKFADHIDSVFGPEPEKLKGYDGHQEIELALVKLYHVTNNAKYLRLSRFFLDERGQTPHFFLEEWKKRGRTVHFPDLTMIHDHAYNQSHLPVRQQEQAVGHAVRLVYMGAGMADVAAETGDAALLEASRKLWRNIVSRRMYITGGIGSQSYGESFTFDYDLPNDTAYSESCAAIGLIFFAQRMLCIEPKSEYADVMERALYNTVLSGISLDGKRFFYVNPLEVYPNAIGKNAIYNHVKPERQGWFGCACCPPNIVRLLASLGQYVYSTKGDTIYCHLYIGGQTEWNFGNATIRLRQNSDYTWNGKSRFVFTMDRPADYTLALRIPDWTNQAEIWVNGAPYELSAKNLADGYALVKRTWQPGDTVDVAFSMPVLRMKGHPHIRQTAGKTALQRGPFVYCMEEADNGENLHRIILPPDGEVRAAFDKELLGGVQVLTAQGKRFEADGQWREKLYRSDAAEKTVPVKIKLIPYFAWANRGVGEMRVWIS
ncbi:MAG TPA: beta-L-arabinofuranosidase domain-containing protein, partial [Bacilli bacterium]